MPLSERYGECHPFLGVVLAGVFTEGSLNQLRSHGFTVLYFPYESIRAAFASAEIDASYDEGTPDAVLLRKVKQYAKLTAKKRERIAELLRLHHKKDLDEFTSTLRAALTRKIESVYVLALHGSQIMLTGVADAIVFIESFDESKVSGRFVRYEVSIRYSNGKRDSRPVQRQGIRHHFLEEGAIANQ